MSVVAEGGAGVLEIRGVRRVGGGEGVARRHCLFHVELSIFASRHGFFVLDLRLTATHVSVSGFLFSFFFSLFLSSLNFRHTQRAERESENPNSIGFRNRDWDEKLEESKT